MLKIKFFKLAGYCGLLSPIFAIIIISISMYYSPWFSWTENWLSELAGSTGETPIWMANNEIAALLFNIGLIVSGGFGLVCVVAIRNISILDSKISRIGTMLLLIDIFALISVGVFPITVGIIHTISAVFLFMLVPLALMPIGFELRKNNEKNAGMLIFILGFISLCSLPFLLIDPPIGGNAVIEMFPVVSLFLSLILFGAKLVKGRFVLA